MMFLTREYIEAHSRLDYDIDDDLFNLYANSAEAQILSDCNRSLESFYEEYGEIPAPVIHAGLMLCDWSLVNKSPASDRNMWEIPYTYTRLIKPYMIL